MYCYGYLQATLPGTQEENYGLDILSFCSTVNRDVVHGDQILLPDTNQWWKRGKTIPQLHNPTNGCKPHLEYNTRKNKPIFTKA